MAALGSQTIASSYEQLLHVDNDGGGNGTTHVAVKDGDNGTTFPITLATDAVMITSTNRLEFGDDGTYIHQSADGVLDLVSDNIIEINGELHLSGNTGSNITPSAWHTSFRAIQLSTGGSGIAGGSTPYSNLALTQNSYLATDSDYKRVNSGYCALITSYSGDWYFQVGGTGSADSSCGFDTPLKINNNNKILMTQQYNQTALEIDAENTDATGVLMTFGSLSTGYGLRVLSSSGVGTNLTTGTLLDVYSKDSNNSSRNLMRIVNDNGGATGTNCLKIHNDAVSTDLFFDHNGADGASIYIDSETTTDSIIYFADPVLTTGYGLRMANMDSLTTGSAILIESDSSDNSTRNLVKIVNDNASADNAVCLFLHQDGADMILETSLGGGIDTNGAYSASSDVLRKKDIVDLPYGLAEVLQLQPRKYKYKKKDIDGIGFVAQELEKIIPEVVSGSDAIIEDVLKKEAVEAVEAVEYVAPTYWEEGDDLPDGVRVNDIKTAEVEAVEAVEAQEAVIEKDVITGGKSVAYGELVSVLVKAIQELEARVKVLES
jgi:hypothetical protein